MTALPLARIGLEQFRARQASAPAVAQKRRMTFAQIEAHLRPWAAIATLCGADLPELAHLRADIEADAREAGWNDGVIRWLLAEEVCPRRRWAALFTAARDAAMDRLHLDDSPEAIANAAALHRIGIALAADINGHPIPAYDASKRIERAKVNERPAVAERSEAEPTRKAA